MADDVDLVALSELTESFTGADLAGLVRQASLQALRDSLQTETTNESDIDLSVHKHHFMSALKSLRPSVSAEVKNQFSTLYINNLMAFCYLVLLIQIVIIISGQNQV